MKQFFEKYSEKPRNLFSKIFFNLLFGYIPFVILHIIFNLTEDIPVNFNGKNIYGIKAILIIITFTPIFILMIAFFAWVYFSFGNFILRTIKKIFYE